MSDDETLTQKQVAAAFPERKPPTDLALIDGRMWSKGPDGLWYRLEGAGDEGKL